jgi:LPS-assembly protein
MRFLHAIALASAGLMCLATGVHAQGLSVADTTTSDKRELVSNKDWHFIGHVELKRPPDTTIYADDVKVATETNQAVAVGNVVFSQGNSWIAAEHAEFDTATGLGTFYSAAGNATIQPPKNQRPGAGAPPQIAGQETDVYFYGDKVEKLGPRKYRITNGGFTTCVQPTPRWQLTSSTVVLNIDHYTMLRNATLNVKGVPLFYTPVLYYPTKRENRSTGILIPTYGTSTLYGSALHNAFFWAINRSQDATFMHDWYASTGQGVGGEYRYNYGNGVDGNFNVHFLDEKGRTFTNDDGSTGVLPPLHSYEIRGAANQVITPRFRARVNINYFSSILSSQTLNTNIYDASRNQRVYGGNVIGLAKGFSFNGTLDHDEYLTPGPTPDVANSTLTGSWPRVSVTRSETPLLGSDLYYSLGGEYVYLLRTSDYNGVVDDSSLARIDFSPQIRYPFKKWTWFSVNSTISWRDTYYTRSYRINPDLSKTVVDEGLDRRFFTFESQLIGPSFTRIWNTPDNGYAEKFKHSIEPYFTVSRTTAIDNFENIVQLEGIDSIVPQLSLNYGVNNRFYAKRRPRRDSPSQISQAREIISVEFTQSYYSDVRGSQYDPRYQTSFNGQLESQPSKFSPMQLSIRATPSDSFNATARAEYDSRYLALRTISATGTYTISNMLNVSLNWTKTAYIAQLAGFNNPDNLTQYLNGSTNIHTPDNRYGSLYSFNIDVLHSAVLQQRITGFYNAQCCGVSAEYQTYNLSGVSSISGSVDRRFFISFTLAGLGNFSPFNGAMNGVPR